MWEKELGKIAKETYHSVAGLDADLDCVEFERWLNKGWLQEKASYLSKSDQSKATAPVTHKAAVSVAATMSTFLVVEPPLTGKPSNMRELALEKARRRTSGVTGKVSIEEEQYAAACALQRRARSHLFRKHAARTLSQDMTEGKAAIMIQSSFRSRKARQLVQQRRQRVVEHKAAVKVQTGWRVKMARREKQRRVQAKRRKQKKDKEKAAKTEMLLEKIARDSPGRDSPGQDSPHPAASASEPDGSSASQPDLREGRFQRRPSEKDAVGSFALVEDQLIVHLAEDAATELATVVLTTVLDDEIVAVVPTSGEYMYFPMRFDRLCHRSLPLKLGQDPMTFLGPLLESVRRGVEILERLEELHDEIRLKSKLVVQESASVLVLSPNVSARSSRSPPLGSSHLTRNSDSPVPMSSSPPLQHRISDNYSVPKVLRAQAKSRRSVKEKKPRIGPMTEYQAATYIQRLYRGRQARRLLVQQRNAVTMLQARIRSRAARRQMLSKAGMVAQRLRELNEELSARFLSELREGLTCTFAEKLLQTLIEKLQTHLDDQSTKHSYLEALRMRLTQDWESCGKECMQIEQFAVERQEALSKEEESLATMEKAHQAAATSTKRELARCDVAVHDARKLVEELESALAKLDGKVDLSNELDAQRAELRVQLGTAKAHEQETDVKMMTIRKHLVDIPLKNLDEQQKRVQQMSTDAQRKKQIGDRRKKALREKQIAYASQRRNIESKRYRIETEASQAIMDAIQINRVAEERFMERTLLEQLRGSGLHGLRRYSAGQHVAIFDRSSGLWQDASVKAYASGRHMCVLDEDGSEQHLVLHPFNHAPCLLSGVDCKRVAENYYVQVREKHATIPDLVQAGQYREPFCVHIDVVQWGAWPATEKKTTIPASESPPKVPPRPESPPKVSTPKPKKIAFSTPRIRPWSAPPKKAPLEHGSAVPISPKTFDRFGNPCNVTWDGKPQATETISTQAVDVPSFTVKDLSEVLHQSYQTRRDGEGLLEEPLIALICAPPSAGKSTLMSQLATLAAERQHMVPIYVHGPLLHARLTNPDRKHIFATSWNWIDAYLRIELGQRSETYAMLRQAMMARRGLLLIDGIDEGGHDSARIRRHLIDVVAPQGHLVVVTSRPPKLETLWPKSCLRATVTSLSDEQQREIIKSRFAPGSARDALLQWRDSTGAFIQDNSQGGLPITANPLGLSLFMNLMEQRQEHSKCSLSPQRAEACSMPSTLTDLYEVVVDCAMTACTQKANIAPAVVDQIQLILQAAAFEAHAANKRELDEGSFMHASKLVVAHAPLQRAARLKRKAGLPLEVEEALGHIKDLVIRGQLPLLTLLRSEPFECLFSHVTFQEYLFVRGALWGFTFPARMEKPWTWGIRWANVLEFGRELFADNGDDSFSRRIYQSCAEEPQSRALNLETRLLSRAERQMLGASRAGPGATRDLHAALDSYHQSAKPDADRSVLLHATVMMARESVDINFRCNRLSLEDLSILCKGFLPGTLFTLNLSENDIGDLGVQVVVNALLAEGANACVLRSLMLRSCGMNNGEGMKSMALFVGQVSRLTLLDIRTNKLTDEGMLEIGNALLRNQTSVLADLRCEAFDLHDVKTLSLSPAALSNAVLVIFSGVLKCNSALRSVSIVDCKCNISTAQALAQSLRYSCNKTLEVLDLTNVNLDDNGVSIISSALTTHPTIKVLRLDNCNFGEGGAGSLAENIRGKSSLVELSVANNHIHEVGVKHIVLAAISLTSLQVLRVDGNGPGTIGAGRIVGFSRRKGVIPASSHATALAHLIGGSLSLTKLDIRQVGLRDEDIQMLGETLVRTKRSMLGLLRCDAFDLGEVSIKELHLRGKAIGSRIAPLIGGVARINLNLIHIDLQSNQLGDNGAAWLAHGLVGSAVERLNMSHNFIRAEGMSAVASALKGNVSLTYLDLSSNEICGIAPDGSGKHSCAGLKALSDNIEHTALRTLNLSSNALSSAGAKALVPVVRNGKALRDLMLVDNNLTFFGLEPLSLLELVSQARHSDSLKMLELGSNHISGVTFRKINPRMVTSPFDHNLLEVSADRCRCHHCMSIDAAAKAKGIATEPASGPVGSLLDRCVWKPSGWHPRNA